MAKRSAGILMYRGRGPELRLLLVHPGGPFWVKKDEGAWSIPKGEYDEARTHLSSLGASSKKSSARLRRQVKGSSSASSRSRAER